MPGATLDVLFLAVLAAAMDCAPDVWVYVLFMRHQLLPGGVAFFFAAFIAEGLHMEKPADAEAEQGFPHGKCLDITTAARIDLSPSN